MTRITNDPPLFPLERGHPLDPPPELGRLRERDPITRMTYPAGPVGWLVTGFAEARAVLADPRFSARQELLLAPNAAERIDEGPAQPGVFNKMDDPEHRRYRKQLTGRFTVRQINALTPVVQRIVDEQVAALAEATPPVDLVSAFAEPVAAKIICALLGFREADRKLLMRHAAVIGDGRATAEEAYRAANAVTALVQRMVRSKIANPGDDLTSELLAAGRLEHSEVMAMVVLLLVGGIDTSANMLALGVLTLLTNPGELAKLRAEPARTEDAVEELLRFLTISHFGVSRCALEDVEIGGHVISKGEVVTVALNAANRDPRRFTDPDRLDVHRADLGHIGFGHGVHQCIGHALARTTLRIGYHALFERIASLRLAIPFEQVRMRHEMVHYGIHELPVTWEGA
jgi:cytochrome P450